MGTPHYSGYFNAFLLMFSSFLPSPSFSRTQVVAKFQSARLTGLDSRDGVLLLGVTHFYVIEGVTLVNGGILVDIESAPKG